MHIAVYIGCACSGCTLQAGPHYASPRSSKAQGHSSPSTSPPRLHGAKSPTSQHRTASPPRPISINSSSGIIRRASPPPLVILQAAEAAVEQAAHHSLTVEDVPLKVLAAESVQRAAQQPPSHQRAISAAPLLPRMQLPSSPQSFQPAVPCSPWESPSSPKPREFGFEPPQHIAHAGMESQRPPSPASSQHTQSFKTRPSSAVPRPGSAVPRPSTAPQPDLTDSFEGHSQARPASAVSCARSPGGAGPRPPPFPFVSVPAPEAPPSCSSDEESEANQPAVTGHSLLRPRASASDRYSSTLEAVERALSELRQNQRQGPSRGFVCANVHVSQPPRIQRPNTYDRVSCVSAGVSGCVARRF